MKAVVSEKPLLKPMGKGWSHLSVSLKQLSGTGHGAYNSANKVNEGSVSGG